MRAISPSKLLYRPLVTPVMAAWWKGVKQTRVFVAPACNVASKGGTHEYGESNLLLLRHPKSGNRTNFLLRNGSLLEVNWFKQFYGSWFLGDYVSEDGSLHIATPVDPIFVLLPLFEEARMKKAEDRGMFRDLNEIMDVDGYPGYRQLLPIVEGSIQLLCEVKEVGSTKFLRLDDLKVLTWLSIKVRNLKEALSALDKNYAAREEKDTLVDVISLLGEYLKDEPWLKLLCNHLKLDIQDLARRPASGQDSPSFAASAGPNVPFIEEKKNANGKSNQNTGKQPKKLKTQVESKNIKDMFRRVTRRV